MPKGIFLLCVSGTLRLRDRSVQSLINNHRKSKFKSSGLWIIMNDGTKVEHFAHQQFLIRDIVAPGRSVHSAEVIFPYRKCVILQFLNCDDIFLPWNSSCQKNAACKADLNVFQMTSLYLCMICLQLKKLIKENRLYVRLFMINET